MQDKYMSVISVLCQRSQGMRLETTQFAPGSSVQLSTRNGRQSANTEDMPSLEICSSLYLLHSRGKHGAGIWGLLDGCR
jgi:hypothetical protein